jgi:hypothetical protein
MLACHRSRHGSWHRARGRRDDATLLDIEAVDPRACRRLDDESRQWIESLTSSGQERELATARLHRLFVDAAHFELQRMALDSAPRRKTAARRDA